MYRNDELWTLTKQYARANGFSEDWATVIDTYYVEGGMDAEIYCVLDEGKFRIVGIDDTGDVLVLDKDQCLHLVDHGQVLESRKLFYYTENTILSTKELPDGVTHLGKAWMNIPMKGE